MKIELVKKTCAFTGDTYFFVRVNGEMLSATWTEDPEKAEKYLTETIEKARKYPENSYETLKLVEI